MKLNILFYMCFSICLIQSFFWLFFPFGGIITVIDIIKDGLFVYRNSNGVIITNSSNNLLHIISSLFTFFQYSHVAYSQYFLGLNPS